MAIVAAPSILPEIAATMVPVIVKPKRMFWYKITKEMLDDWQFMNFLLTNPKSDFYQYAARQAGIDMSKKFDCQIIRDDFPRNTLTIKIMQ